MNKGSMKRGVKALVAVSLGVAMVVGALAMPETADAVKKKAAKKPVKKVVAPAKKIYNNVATATLIKALATGSKDSASVVSAQIAANADPNVKDAVGRTALTWAAKNGDPGSVKALIAAKAVVNVTDAEKKTPLMWAVMSGRADNVKALLAAKADVKPVDANGDTVLLMAANRTYGNWSSDAEEILKVLISSGAVVNLTDKQGRTPLHYAAVGGSPKAVQILVDAKADVSKVVPETGETALMAACQVADNADYAQVVTILGKAGTNINAKDLKGNTALILASGKGMPYIVKAVLALKPDVNVKNLKGESALEKAYQVSNLVVIPMLQSAGAQR
ncbi:MAG: ankyrin repeat domain-containing protein [Solirubrobacterales bacterium]